MLLANSFSTTATATQAATRSTE